MDALHLTLPIPREALVHTAFVIFACGFLVRSALWLRILAISGYSIFVTFALSSTGSTRWHFLAWYLVFLALNARLAFRLLRARRTPRLEHDERRLVELAFPAADAGTVGELLRKGRWLTLQPGKCLTRQGEACSDVYVILEGHAAIETDEIRIARAGPGQFLGEVSLLASAPAMATARAEVSGLRVLAWDQKDLRALMTASPGVGSMLHAAFGRDLARKMAVPQLAGG